MKEEIWKSMKDFEEGYLISNIGRIKSKERVVDYGGNMKALRKSKILGFRVGKYGYTYTVISLYRVRKTVKHHRLVAEHFIPNPENLPQVNHIDGSKFNNSVYNLEWCTSKQNMNHAYRTGLKHGVRGELSHYSKLHDSDIMEIRHLRFVNGVDFYNLSVKFKVSISQIKRICNGNNWAHIKYGINGENIN